MFLEDRPVVVSFLWNRGVLREAEGSILEHEVRHIFVGMVPQGIDPTIANTVRELRRRER